MARRKTVKGEDYGDIYENLALLAEEKGISSEILAEKIKYAIEKSLKSNLHFDDDEEDFVRVDIDLEKKIFDVSIMKEVIEVVDTLYEPEKEIVLEEARKIDPTLEVGDRVRCPIDTKLFKRIAAKNAKDLIKQGFSNAERQHLSEIWGEYENEAVSATVETIEPKTLHATLKIGGNEVMLPRSEQIPGETLEVGQVIRVYISGVSKEYKEGDKNQYLKVSRTDKWLIKRLFELEVPEIHSGIVEVKSIAREAGNRTKIAVVSHDENVDPIGACVGTRGARVANITGELNGEKIDIIKWNEDMAQFVSAALAPADVINATMQADNKSCRVIVPDDQLSLAIGKEGQNARLAAKLTGCKIDIGPESQANLAQDDDDLIAE